LSGGVFVEKSTGFCAPISSGVSLCVSFFSPLFLSWSSVYPWHFSFPIQSPYRNGQGGELSFYVKILSPNLNQLKKIFSFYVRGIHVVIFSFFFIKEFVLVKFCRLFLYER